MNQAYLKNILSAKFDFNVWKELFDKFFPKVDIFTTVAKISDIHVKDGGHIGNIRLDDGRSLAIFRFEVADNVIISRNRKSLRDIAAKYVDQGLIHGALVFYYSQNQDDYRLTFIAKQTYFNENGELVKKETAPKRYTFLLGKNEPCTTAAIRLMELADKKSSGSVFLADVTDTFSVERLNKEFFKGYKEQYAKFLKLLEDKKQHRDYVKKLLGRLVFLQFLQKKGWMGVPASNENWEGGDRNYLANLIERYKGNDRILSDVLEPLFFDTLNKERVGDIADSRLGNNIKIPYLNGGLFDKDKIDALDIDFPYSYFEDLMKFFNEYNFTIDENDPDDAEVGVDPEMLGHIFENLLEDNKDKGAFYTPKEIVQYMCRQSVIQYLKTHEPDEKYSLAIERLINESVVEPVLQNKATASRFIELLKDVKVCDPAIGSGAFPMGILYVLYYALHHLQSHAEPNKSFDSTKTKRNIIQNNIFGVDIEQGAVDIARLRFWLALVVDADEPHPLPNLDYKITCGNSLLNRYALDTPLDNVFIEYNKDKNDDDKLSLAKYKQLVNDYTNTSNHAKKDLFRKTIEEIKKTFKTELSKKEINKIVSVKKDIYDLEQPNLFGEELSKAQKSELKKLKAKLEKLESEREDVLNNKVYEDAFEWRFEFPQLLDENGDFIGFDIIIGNPPYVDIKSLPIDDVRLYFTLFETTENRINLYSIFIEKGVSLLSTNGILCYINPNSILMNESYFKVRSLIINYVDTIIKLPDTVFESATVETIILLLMRNNSNPEVKGACFKKNDYILFDNLTFDIFNRNDWIDDSDRKFNIFANNNIRNVINKIKKGSIELGSLVDTSLGITPYDKYKGHDEKTIKNRLFHSVTKIDSSYVPLISGKNIHPFYVSDEITEYLKYGTWLGAPRERKFFEEEKIIIRQILSGEKQQIIAAYSDKPHFFTQIGFSIISKNRDVDMLKFLTCLLNSPLMTFYHRYVFLDIEKIVFQKILIANTKKLPIKTPKDFSHYVDYVNSGEYSNMDIINKLIYKLYNLTYDDVLIVDPETRISREEYEGGDVV